MADIDSLSVLAQPSLDVLAQPPLVVHIQPFKALEQVFLAHPLLCAIAGAFVGAVLSFVGLCFIYGRFTRRDKEREKKQQESMRKKEEERQESMRKEQTKQQKIKDAIETTKEIAVLLNDVVSCLFWKIRVPDIPDANIDCALRNAFRFRIKYKITIRAYFTAQDYQYFKDGYDSIIKEMAVLRRSMLIHKDSKKATKVKEAESQAITHINKLNIEWRYNNSETDETPINTTNEDDSFDKKLGSPYSYYCTWNKIIWRKSQDFTWELLEKFKSLDL
jgi:hypothetical protein